ncbi:MAG: mevalonate kinase family protein [Blastocatellia bacterium]
MRLFRTTAYARAGLIGNPSDGYYGRTISLILRNFSAQVVIYEWPQLEILPTRQDHCRFDSLDEFLEDARINGYYGGLRLVKAAIKRFADYCREQGIDLAPETFSLRYDSTIPRQVGLAGSSAIITATMRALMVFYDVSIPREILPSLILSVETEELKMGAGLQDRVIQVYEGLVSMDFRRELLEARGYGEYEPLDPALLPPLYIAYQTDLAESSDVFHNDIRRRYDRGEPAVVEAMKRFAELAAEAREALLARDHQRLARLMDLHFDTRRTSSTRSIIGWSSWHAPSGPPPNLPAPGDRSLAPAVTRRCSNGSRRRLRRSGVPSSGRSSSRRKLGPESRRVANRRGGSTKGLEDDRRNWG